MENVFLYYFERNIANTMLEKLIKKIMKRSELIP